MHGRGMQGLHAGRRHEGGRVHEHHCAVQIRGGRGSVCWPGIFFLVAGLISDLFRAPLNSVYTCMHPPAWAVAAWLVFLLGSHMRR